MRKFETNREWLKPFPFRVASSVRSYEKDITIEKIDATHDFSIDFENKCYRITEWRSFLDASNKADKAINRAKILALLVAIVPDAQLLDFLSHLLVHRLTARASIT